MAGSGGPDVRPGKEKLPTAQADAGHACHAPGNKRSSPRCLTRTGLLRAAEHGFYRAGESNRPTWGCSSRPPHVGDGSAVLAPAGPSRVVASLLPLCASPCLAPGDARAAASARWQTSSPVLPAAYPCHGSGKNEPMLDSEGGALLSLTSCATLHQGCVKKVGR
jgi:hypothetical protein